MNNHTVPATMAWQVPETGSDSEYRNALSTGFHPVLTSHKHTVLPEIIVSCNHFPPASLFLSRSSSLPHLLFSFSTFKPSISTQQRSSSNNSPRDFPCCNDDSNIPSYLSIDLFLEKSSTQI
jgi:hypothetical protein